MPATRCPMNEGGARPREQKLLDRCAAVATGVADRACDEQEANVFRSAAVVIESRFLAESKRLRLSAIRYLGLPCFLCRTSRRDALVNPRFGPCTLWTCPTSSSLAGRYSAHDGTAEGGNMRPIHLRFVGATELPKTLSDFDVQQSFRISSADVAAIRERFRADRRLGVAVQLVFLRATGRPLDRTASVPRALLRSLCAALGAPETAIASLKTIYQRVATLYEHQQWAREHAGIVPADDAVMAELGRALESLAATAASVDELVQEAELWLFGRQHLLPADRALRDLARKAYAFIEAAALEAVNSEVPAHKQSAVLAAVFSSRRGRGGGTVLEWLKIPAGKHSPTSITEVTAKISSAPRASACVACVWRIQCGLARRSFSAVAGLSASMTSATCAKKRRMTLHRRAALMPAALS
ncbi:MAG: hypothetical protein DI587_11040 [Variovorax paradoxus]|nr:MAG: hypothetical protein DI583_11040 [Variovorax paradoxus]PZQ10986.1 MAG: hypothetical protein DI587_11040 [Variovorax paradoxus]